MGCVSEKEHPYRKGNVKSTERADHKDRDMRIKQLQLMKRTDFFVKILSVCLQNLSDYYGW